MPLKKLEVPTTSITEVKKSPMDVFQQAREAGTGVYVFNREKVAGVMLTQEQYETLLQELFDKRAILENPEISKEVVEERTVERTPEVVVQMSPYLEELFLQIRKEIVSGSSISAKNLDEKLVSLGFITKKSGFGGVNEMLHELNETGKVLYQFRGKPEGKSILAEVIGEPDNQSQLFDKLIIKKIHLVESKS